MVAIRDIIAEVFGHAPDDFSDRAVRYRAQRLCPFNNKVPSCTKDKARNPLDVCSILHGGSPVITCPVRFREDWLIVDDAATFFFAGDLKWTTLAEVRLNDADGKSAGNIDIVLVAYDDAGRVMDFGALEVQAVYISGNIRASFEHYMRDPARNLDEDWPDPPRPDYLSSSRKRLVPQLLYKGGILHSWRKKTAVALSRSFFGTLPELPVVSADEADIAWMIYDLVPGNGASSGFTLRRDRIVHTRFEPSLLAITSPRPGPLETFMSSLQERLDRRLKSAPDNFLTEKPFQP